MRRRVVITGMSVVPPIGNDAEQVQDSAQHSRCGANGITHPNVGDFRARLASEARSLDMEQYSTERDLKLDDRFTRSTRIAARQAYENSDLQDTEFDRDCFGVITGSGVGGIPMIEDMSQTIESRGPSRISPYFIPMSLVSLAVGNAAIDTDAHGDASSVVTARAAATNAIGEALHRIRDGYEDAMAAGGSEAVAIPVAMAEFTSMQALHEGEGSNHASIPFDAERKGFVVREGVGVLILEELKHVLARNVEIYGEVVGHGSTRDADHITVSFTDRVQAARTMTMAIEDGVITAVDVNYINVHGASTPFNDTSETLAVKKASGAATMRSHVPGTKSMSGRLLGINGALEAITSTLVVENGFVLATISYHHADPACDLDLVASEGKQASICIAMFNSLGFDKHNASILIRRWKE